MQTLGLEHTVNSVCWNGNGSRLLTGGACLTLWEDCSPLQDMEQAENGEGEGEGRKGMMEVVWRCSMADALSHVKFSPCGSLFATCGQVCIKIRKGVEERSSRTGL